MPFLTEQLGRPTGILAGRFFSTLWNRRNASLNDAAFSYLSSLAVSRVLEVGFGGGYLLNRIIQESPLAPAPFTAGVDHSFEMVKYACRRFRQELKSGRLCLALASADGLPWPGGSFDCVVSVNSIFYWVDPIRVFSEFSRVLAPPGKLVLIYTCANDLKNRPFNSRDLGLHEPEQVQKWLQSTGFIDIEIKQGQDRYRPFGAFKRRWGILRDRKYVLL